MSTEQIASLARTCSSNIPPWTFNTTGNLVSSDRRIKLSIGELEYANSLYQIIGGCIKVKDWYFCLERMVPGATKILVPGNGTTEAFISAFHKNSHYIFSPVEIKAGCGSLLLQFITAYILPILEPSLLGEENIIKVSWELDIPVATN